ncbi:hypothetical protein Droror1_Dr00004499 [Drosera rotundifolia]
MLKITSSHTKLFTSVHQSKLLHQHVLVSASHAAPAILAGISPPPNTLLSWHTLIRESSKGSDPRDAIRVFGLMRGLGWGSDSYSVPFTMKAAGEVRAICVVEMVHGVAVVDGLDRDLFVGNAAVVMYGKWGEVRSARKVFDEMFERGVWDRVSWNSIVGVCVRGGGFEQGLELFRRMGREVRVCPDAVGLASVLPACAGLGAAMKGREVHCLALRRGLDKNVFVGNALVDMYVKCGKMEAASVVFESIKVKDVVSWNSLVTGFSQVGRFNDVLLLFEEMRKQKIELDIVTWSAAIAGYAKKDCGYEALDVFRQMVISGSIPNIVTFVSLLSACACVGALLQGMESHCYAIKHILKRCEDNLDGDLMIINGLIDMYSKCKELRVARAVFDSVLPEDRNVVTWTVMIGGYAQHGEANEALELFFRMMHQGNHFCPNAYTMSCILMACARLGALHLGKQIHAYELRNNFEPEVTYVANCLIDTYSKSGDIGSARAVFDNMSKRNAVSWTSMLASYGFHGRGEDALHIFEEMKKAGFNPDGVTFLVLLYACSHSGMTDHGIKLFDSMSSKFGVAPGVEHYASVVDLLGRAGRLQEALKLVVDMPVKPGPVVWIALLSACRVHGNVDLGEYAASKLFELEQSNDGAYALLSNLYAKARRWKDVARIRTQMKHSGVKKRAGCSWFEGKRRTEVFYAGDWSHPESGKVQEFLSNLFHRIKAMGYVPETSFALHDVDDQEKGDLLFEHSEKLAIAYAILTSAPGATIRIFKNLRVCGDCHLAITYISKIVNHEIILRDSSRFHHFKDGSCSCRGYW